MLFKTKGVVLHTLNYSENSIIIKAYTENDGLQSFIVKTGRNKKSPIKSGLFQPLSVLCMESYQSKTQGLHHIKEVSVAVQLMNIYYDTRKSAIAFFIAELLHKSLKEDSPNKDLFDFILKTVEIIDKTEERIADFHLFFMIALSKHLGFFPRNNFDKQHPIFNMMEGCFQEHLPEHSYYTDKIISEHLHLLLNTSFDNFSCIHLKSDIKKELLNKIINYYCIHVHGFHSLNSHIVLEEVFN